MSELDQIVDVSISTDSKTPSRQGFGTPLFLTYHTRFPEKYRSYGSLREVAEDFESYDSAYRMAAACFSQNPTVKKIIVGRLPSAPSFTRTLTMTNATEGQLVKFKAIAPQAGTIFADVRLATAAALPTYNPAGTGVGHTLTATGNGALTVDGVAVAAGDRILVKNQTGLTQDDNGIYTVTDEGDGSNPFVLTRATDADTSALLNAGVSVEVEAGTANTGTFWVLVTNSITIDTTALTFSQVPTWATISPTGAVSAGDVISVEYTVQSGDTTTNVAEDIDVVLEAIPGFASSQSNAIVTVSPTTAGNQIWVYDLENCTTEETTADAGYDDELTALQAVNDEWYFVLTDSCSAANVALVGAWALAAKKLYFVNTDSSGELAGTGTIGSALKALSNDRTVIIYSPNTHEFAAAAWVGVGAPKDPGSITWAYKTLRGVTPKNLNTSQRSALEADNINHYQTIAALSATRPGKVAFGEWINVIHGIDALKVRIQEDLWSAFVNSDVIPYTAAGLDVVSNIILASMKAFEGTRDVPGLLVVGSSQVIMPDFADISANDKAARRLENVRISATLTGAIHYVGIDGTISV